MGIEKQREQIWRERYTQKLRNKQKDSCLVIAEERRETELEKGKERKRETERQRKRFTDKKRGEDRQADTNWTGNRYTEVMTH